MADAPWEPRLAQRLDRLRPSLVREILAAATRPGMISFAGGLPAPDLMPPWPAAVVQDAQLYQYGTTEGEPRYREAVARWVGAAGLPVAPSQVLALGGSQQGLDLVAKLLIDPGTPVVVEGPTYLAALQVFELFGARIAPVPLADAGPDLPALERLLAGHRPACLYLVPTFQNPAGLCYDADARRAVAELLDHYGTLLVEDDPYRPLALDGGEPPRPICAWLKRAPWIYLGSFSKILWPGARIGYLAARPDLVPRLAALKQAADLHTQRPAQLAAAHWLDSPARPADLERLRAGYRARRDAMDAALRRHLGDLADWRLPPGGLFFWLRLRRGEATRGLLDRAMARGVAFMPGDPFFACAEPPRRYLRLNYSHARPAQMDEGLQALAQLLGDG